MSKKGYTPEIKSGSMSFIGKMFRFLIFIICLGFVAAIYLILQPQSLSDIDGQEASVRPSRNLQEVFSKAIEGDYSVSLSEAEINQMLERELVAEQGGLLGKSASVKRVLVRLKQNLAEVIMVREVFGQVLTTSMYLQFEQTESESGISTRLHLHGSDLNTLTSLPKVGGRFGKLTIPQGFLIMVMPDFKKIAETLSPEIKLGFEEMARFEIQDKRIILDPRKPTRHVGGEKIPF